MSKRRIIGNKVKAAAALEAAKGVKTLSEIAKEYRVHPIQVGKWRAKLLENAYQVFEDGGVVNGQTHEREVNELYEQIGRLKVERDFLKNKSGINS
jgi:transposase